VRKLTTDEIARKSVAEFKASEKLPVVVILDNVRSMMNVGSIFRTCDAFLVEHLYLVGFTGQPPHREIEKTALGSTQSVAWSHTEDGPALVQTLKQQGYQIIAFEQTATSTSLNSFHNAAQKVALIFGNEVRGVDQALLDASDVSLEIPQFGTKHSLNIAVAAGIGIYHFAEHYAIQKQSPV
jgi:23S rRNA (guanosine2251-2'-O)-methyltransferase